jgi:hypothetical protein
MSSAQFDVVIVGSGPSGVQAAVAAVRRGLQVALMDVGHRDDRYESLIPDKPFSEIRQTDPQQQRYFLGESIEEQLRDQQEVGAQLTPPRRFIVRDAERHLVLQGSGFEPLQSLALGGLAAGWGAGCATYEDFELRRAGLPPPQMRRYYEEVAKDIGVSGASEDDVSPHVTNLENLQEPLEIDSNAESLLLAYVSKRQSLQERGFKLGRPPLAVLSHPLGERQANPYHDMDFYSDHRESVYRPRYTIRELQKESNFTYLSPLLVDRFEEAEGATIHALNLTTGQPTRIQGRRLLLAAGAINTARIVLRSLEQYDVRVPILCNSYTYLPALNLRMLGRSARDRRHSLVQLTGIFFPPEQPEEQVVVQFYSYRSLLLFRLVKEMPLPPALALALARLMVTSLFVVGVNHPDRPSAHRYLELRRRSSSEAQLIAHGDPTPEEARAQRRRERQISRLLLSLRCVPLRLIRLVTGASIHYAGTLPFSDEEKPLTCSADGRIRGTRFVYAADGSPWRFLPAKGLTFSLMANARRVADRVADELRAAP